MKWTRPSIFLVLVGFTAVGIEDEGPVNIAAYWFIFFSVYFMYKYWVKRAT